MHVGKNDCFIAICNHPAFLKLRNSYFQFLHWRFTLNYKDQTDSKLPESGLCAQIILKHVFL